MRGAWSVTRHAPSTSRNPHPSRILGRTPCRCGRNRFGCAAPLGQVRICAIPVPCVGDRRESAVLACSRFEEQPGAAAFRFLVGQTLTKPRQRVRDGLRFDSIDLPYHPSRVSEFTILLHKRSRRRESKGMQRAGVARVTNVRRASRNARRGPIPSRVFRKHSSRRAETEPSVPSTFHQARLCKSRRP